MIYKSTIPANVEQARTKLEWLISKGKTFELKEQRAKRSISQNSYLHLLFSWFAYEYGETEQYVKQFIFKEVVNADIFASEYTNPKTNEVRDCLRSTADLNTKEMTKAIDAFRDFSSKEADIYLPEPSDLTAIQDMENELKNRL
tara:strand:- start:5751 stop:6182 length:432 start_codon:yes stop_codon:yes gene_type:complete